MWTFSPAERAAAVRVLRRDVRGRREAHVEGADVAGDAQDVHGQGVGVQGGHRADEPVHATGSVGHVDEHPPVPARAVLDVQQHLQGRHRGADAGDEGGPRLHAGLARQHRVEHRQAGGQGHREVGQCLLVDRGVDPAAGPEALEDPADVVPAGPHPHLLDPVQLGVPVRPGEALELEEVPAALGVGEHRDSGCDDRRRRGVVGDGCGDQGDPVTRIRGDLVGQHQGEELGAAAGQLPDPVLG